MQGRIIRLCVLVLFTQALWFSCSHTASPPAPAPANEYEAEIALAQEEVKTNPENFEAVRKLGILFFKSGQFDKAIPVLEKANLLKALDPRTVCYLGLSYEMSRQGDLATATYLQYLQVPAQSPYRRWLKGRHDLLTRQKRKEKIIARLLQQEQPDSAAVSDSFVAVLPFPYHGKDQKYFLLGKGLQAMIINDLKLIEGLKIVDRWHVQVLSDEISRRESLLQNVENRTAWIGKQLNASTILTGGYNIAGDEQLILDAAYWDLTKDQLPATTTHANSLTNIFELQKDVVLGFLEKMKIEPEKALRDSILKMPLDSVPALVAYSAGLAKEDAGEYGDAQVFYRKAVELAPGFKECARKIEEMEALSLALRDPDKVITGKEFAEKE